MSYDIAIKTKSGETLRLPTTHNIAGGTFRLGGTDEAWLNVTYNFPGDGVFGGILLDDLFLSVFHDVQKVFRHQGKVGCEGGCDQTKLC